jgi:hypothetical protein
MGNKPQVSSAIIIHSPLQISWNDVLHQGQTADVSIIRAKTGTFSIETLDIHLAPDGREARFGLIRPSRHARGQPLTYERGLVIFEYFHFRSGGSLMIVKKLKQ